MPASNPRAIEKAAALPADVIILDLEDAVASESKDEARSRAVEAVRARPFGSREVVVRINALDTPWGEADLAAAVACAPDAVLAPKVSSPEDVSRYASAMEAGSAKLWLMIETCGALFRLNEIAQAAPGRLSALVMGTNDLAKEMRCALRSDRRPLWGALASTVAAARANRLAVLDGVANALDDGPDLRDACDQGVEFGFDGKTLIHPAQIAAANAAFSPSADALAWARGVVAAFDDPHNAAKGAIRLAGKMVERLHLSEARQILAIATAIRDQPPA